VSAHSLALIFIYAQTYPIGVGGRSMKPVLQIGSLFLFATLALMLAVSVSAAPVPGAPGQNKLLCFDGTSDGGIYAGTCTLLSKGAKGTAVLDNDGGDVDGEYSGVYVLYSNVYGMSLFAITQLSFQYTGTATAGSPRYSIPIDTNNDGLTDFWAFISAYYCNNGAGLVDAINDATCTIYVSNDPLVSYANWAAFVAAYPGAEVALTDNYIFIVADDAGYWTVNNVKFGKAGK
jgi:hypothetical protein